MNGLGNFLIDSIYLLFYSLIFVFSGGLIIDLIEKKSNYYLQRSLGYGGMLITGLGTVVHEFSHLVFVLLGAMKPVEVKLFRPIQGKIDGVLGYVSYVAPGSKSKGVLKFYNKIFLIPIGIAPIIGGTLTILGSLRLCLPYTFKFLIDNIKTLNISIENISKEIFYDYLDLTKLFLQNLFTIDNITDIRFWIFMFIVLSVASHMSLSTADIKGCLRGIPYLLFVIIVANVFFVFKGYDAGYIYNILKTYNGYVMIFLSISIMFSILNLILSVSIGLFLNILKK